jgi:putative transposase
VQQCSWLCYAWCLMDNHWRLLIQTLDGNLSKGMRQLNGVFTQTSDRRRRRAGHLFQDRFEAILVHHDAYLLALARCILLRPVRAGMVKQSGGWCLSSYGISMAWPRRWFARGRWLAQFAKRRSLAQVREGQFVM